MAIRKINRIMGGGKVAIVRLRDYLGLLQLGMITIMFFEDRQLEWWHYLLFLTIPLIWYLDKRFVHPFEMMTTQLRSPVTRKMYQTALRLEKWLDEHENNSSTSKNSKSS